MCRPRNTTGKIEYYGVVGSQFKIFESYLRNRRHRVVVKESKSDATQTEYGVPQGSVLGTFLFLVMVNDIHDDVFANKVMFRVRLVQW